MLSVLLLGGTTASGAEGVHRQVCVADFEGPVQTTRGGWFHVRGGSPAVIQDQLVQCGQPEAWAWRIDVSADAPAAGCAAVLPLYDNLAEQRPAPVDVGRDPRVSLRLVGDLGQRQLKVAVRTGSGADHPLERVGDGPLTLSDDRWQTHTWGLPAGQRGRAVVTAIEVQLAGEGPAWLALDQVDIGLGAGADDWPVPPRGRATDDRRALWVWFTDRLFSNEQNPRDLLKFANDRGISDLFIQVRYEFAEGNVELQHVDAWRRFLPLAHADGIRVHALDGNPNYVLPEHHPRMFALIDALHDFNQAGSPAQRFAAVHMDNEPYVMPAWRDDSQRQAIIDATVLLNSELRRRVNAAGMEYGIDIPFWYDVAGPDGQPRFVANTPQGHQPLVEALITGAQNVGIMSYRDRITGPNGAVALCQHEFALARAHGVAVMAALEVGVGKNVEKGTTLGVYPQTYIEQQLATMNRALQFETGCSGLALHYYGGFQELEQNDD